MAVVEIFDREFLHAHVSMQIESPLHPACHLARSRSFSLGSKALQKTIDSLSHHSQEHPKNQTRTLAPVEPVNSECTHQLQTIRAENDHNRSWHAGIQRSRNPLHTFQAHADTLELNGAHNQSWHSGMERNRSRTKSNDNLNTQHCSKRATPASGFVATLCDFLKSIVGVDKVALRSIVGVDKVALSPSQDCTPDDKLNLATKSKLDAKPSPLLDLMSENSKIHCIKLMEKRSYKGGEKIVQVGELGDAVFIIEKGSAVASLHGQSLQTLKEGSFFGEISFLANSLRLLKTRSAVGRTSSDHDQFRTCDVIAAEHCDCWTLSVSDFVQVPWMSE